MTDKSDQIGRMTHVTTMITMRKWYVGKYLSSDSQQTRLCWLDRMIRSEPRSDSNAIDVQSCWLYRSAGNTRADAIVLLVIPVLWKSYCQIYWRYKILVDDGIDSRFRLIVMFLLQTPGSANNLGGAGFVMRAMLLLMPNCGRRSFRIDAAVPFTLLLWMLLLCWCYYWRSSYATCCLPTRTELLRIRLCLLRTDLRRCPTPKFFLICGDCYSDMY